MATETERLFPSSFFISTALEAPEPGTTIAVFDGSQVGGTSPGGAGSLVHLRAGIDVPPALGDLGTTLIGNVLGGGALISPYDAFVNDDTGLRK